ncbi:hypothetical protein OC835_008048, partial [Tilletia horrida]
MSPQRGPGGSGPQSMDTLNPGDMYDQDRYAPRPSSRSSFFGMDTPSNGGSTGPSTTQAEQIAAYHRGVPGPMPPAPPQRRAAPPQRREAPDAPHKVYCQLAAAAPLLFLGHFESLPPFAASSNTDGSNPAASSSSTPRSVSASASASSLTSNAPPNPPAFKIMRRDPSAPRLTHGMLALSASMAAANLDNGTGDALTSSTSSSSTTSHSQASTPNGSGNLTDPFAAQGDRGFPFPTTGASFTASSTASLVGTPTSAGGTIKKDRRNMTIEEREAAYKEARERIFQDFKPANAATSSSSSSSAAGAASAAGSTSSPAGSTISAPGGSTVTEDGTRIGGGSNARSASVSTEGSNMQSSREFDREFDRREFSRGSLSTGSLPSASSSSSSTASPQGGGNRRGGGGGYASAAARGHYGSMGTAGGGNGGS